VQQVAGLLALIPAVAVPPSAQQLAGEPIDVGQPGHSGAGEHCGDGGGGDLQDRGQPHGAGMVFGARGHDLRSRLRQGLPGHVVRAGGAVGQPGLALGASAAHPLVDRLPAEAQLLGHLAWAVTGQDTVDDQLAGVDGRAGFGVGHRDLRL
jgi:hypothetical protein